MKLIPDQDECDLASTLRAMLAAQRGSPALWNSLVDTGVLGLGVPEECGGSGGTLDDLGVFYVEAGRALCPTIAHATTLAAVAINGLGNDEQRAHWLPQLSSGALRATTALWSARDASDITPVLQAAPTTDGWQISGATDFVIDANQADVVVITAADGNRTLGFVVRLDDPAVRLEPLQMMGGFPAFRVTFDGVAVGDDSAVGDRMGLRADDVRRVANAAVALLSLDLVGVGEAVLARTVDYTTMRHQFGRPIASFQAAQHLVANMHIALAAARLAARSAVFWIGRGRTATRETAVARIQSAAAAKLITLDAHQLHGGMGYVTETDLHLWSERARVLSTLGGGADVAAAWLDTGRTGECQKV